MTRRAVLPLDRQCVLSGLPAPVAEFKFHPTRKWRFDFAWPAQSFAVEVDGAVFVQGRHTRGVGVEADMEKFAEAMLAGWRVLRVSTNQVKDGRALAWVERMLR
jgi:very-short-patch-repair endonuclease